MEPLLEKIHSLGNRFGQVEESVHAFLPEPDRFQRLEEEAHHLLEKYPDPNNRPPLFGLLTGVKDIFRVSGFETHAGSRLPAEVLAGEEARSVAALKRSGALIVGKTVTTEFAYFAPGPTRNPHNLAHTPGGSSSGSAAAVAAGLCELALGTQTIGSVNRPAAFCGVSGYKPSYDRISKQGVIPLSGSLDHVGLFAGSIQGLLPAAAVLARDFQPVQRAGLIRLAIPVGEYLERASEEAQSHLENVARHLETAGIEVQRRPFPGDFQEIYDRHQLVLAAEAAEVHRMWYELHAQQYSPKTRELILKGRQIPDAALSKARKGNLAFRQHLESVMENEGIDAWLTPSAPGPAPAGLESTGDPVMNLPWTQAGLPTITIPSGASRSGLPLATQIIGRWYQDEALFAAALQIEKTIGLTISPKFHI